jgi:hypothetical protein
VTARLVDATGTPVAGQPVTFQILGDSAITVDRSVVTTDAAGLAQVTVSHTGSGPFVVAALADDFTAHANIAIRPILSLSRSVAPAPAIPGTSVVVTRPGPPPAVPLTTPGRRQTGAASPSRTGPDRAPPSAAVPNSPTELESAVNDVWLGLRRMSALFAGP